MRRFAVAIALILLTAACSPAREAGTGSPTSSVVTTSTTLATTTTSVGGVVSQGDLEIILLPDSDGSYPEDMLVTACEITVPFAALNDIEPLVDADQGGIQEAIEPFLANEEGAFWPQEDWLLLFRDELRAIIVNVSEPDVFASMQVEMVDGDWRWSGSSLGEAGCPLKFAKPDDLNEVVWRFDESKPDPDQDSASLHLILNERNCTGGIEIGDRLVGPQLVMTEDHVSVAFAAEPPPGEFFECPGNPELAYELELPDRLGDRLIRQDSKLGVALEDFLP